MTRFSNLFAVMIMSLSFIIAGCTPTATETSHSAPKESGPQLSLKETLEKTRKLADKLNQGFADGAGHDVVHDPLHEISNMLDALPKQIASSDLSDENKASLTTAVNALMDHYGKIDAKFHGGEGAEYADVKDGISDALDSLDSVRQSMN